MLICGRLNWGGNMDNLNQQNLASPNETAAPISDAQVPRVVDIGKNLLQQLKPQKQLDNPPSAPATPKIMTLANKITLKQAPKPHKIVINPAPEPEPNYSIIVAGYDPNASRDEIEADFHQYKLELDANPKDLNIIVKLAEIAYRLENYEFAGQMYEKALPSIFANISVLYRLGLCFFNIGNYEKAEEYFAQALEINPEDENLYMSIASVKMKLAKFTEAIKFYQIVIEKFNPKSLALLYIAHCYNLLNDTDKALETINMTMEIFSEHGDCYLEKALIYRKINDFETAINALNYAIKLEPNNPTFWGHLGALYGDYGDDYKCLDAYTRSLELDPNSVNIGFNTGMQLLGMGHWATGFSLYSLRYQREDFKKMHQKMFSGEYNSEHWQGEDVKDKILYLHAEQGYGDSIMTIRFVKTLKQMGAKQIIVEAPDVLHETFQNLSEIDLLVTSESREYIANDYHCPLMELPRFLNITPENIPLGAGYLQAPNDGRFQVKSKKKYVFALVWRGSPLHPRDVERSLPLQVFQPMIDALDVQWLSIQRGAGADEIRDVPLKHKLYNIGNNFRNFADSAALLSQCDCVIGIDTAPIHLAGALGIRTYLLLDHWNDWRWLKNTDTTKWYDSVKLFRIPPRHSPENKWDDAILRMTESLINEFP